MRLDSTIKKSSPIYIGPKNLDTILMHWMSVKLADNFQLCEHSWPCLFHIIYIHLKYTIIRVTYAILDCSVVVVHNYQRCVSAFCSILFYLMSCSSIPYNTDPALSSALHLDKMHQRASCVLENTNQHTRNVHFGTCNDFCSPV